MKLRFLLGLAISASGVGVASYLSGGRVMPGYLALDLGLVIALPLAMALGAFGPRGLASVASSETGLRWLGRATLVAAVLGFITIQLWMMTDLSDPSAIPVNLAYSLEPPILGLFMALCVYRPLRYAAGSRTRGDVPATTGAQPANGGAALRRRVGLAWLAGAALALIAFLAWHLFAYGRIVRFLDLPALALTVFLPVGQLLAGPGVYGLREAISSLGSGDEERLEEARRTFYFLAGSFGIAAGLALLLGGTFFLAAIGDRMRYGPTMALAEVGLLQSALLYLLVGLPPLAAADRELESLEGNGEGARKPGARGPGVR